jgi:HD-like signal output (HDOD) protein
MNLEEGLEERKQTEKQVRILLNQVEALPTLPSVATHVFHIASDPHSSADDLTAIISNDPPLTSKLLKIVNSAFYGFPQRIGTVRQAVVILGSEEIVNLSFGLVASKVFEKTGQPGSFSPRDLWRHSLSTALIAQNICQRYPDFQKSGVFTSGLLHDFGKIFLIENFNQAYEDIYEAVSRNNLPLFEMEEDRFGLSHAAIGEFLASNWNLPDTLIQAIACHHHPLLAPQHAQFAAIVGLADYLAHRAVAPEGAHGEGPTLVPQLTFGHWTMLTALFGNLDASTLDAMVEEAVTVIENNSNLFEILD